MFINDTISVTATITEKRDHPRRPEFGIVIEAIAIANQDAKPVLACEHLYLAERRTPAAINHREDTA